MRLICPTWLLPCDLIHLLKALNRSCSYPPTTSLRLSVVESILYHIVYNMQYLLRGLLCETTVESGE